MDLHKREREQREEELTAVLQMVVDEGHTTLDCDRSSLFVLDREKEELWTKVTDGIDSKVNVNVRMPWHKGLAGRCLETGEIINVADAYDTPWFNQAFDKQSGYRTQSVLCLPVHAMDAGPLDEGGQVVAVLQLINKMGDSAD